MELLCHGAVSEQAGREGHLQRDPVLADAHVEDVARVRRAGCMYGLLSVSLSCLSPGRVNIHKIRLALMFLCGLDFRHRDAEALAVVDVQAHLTSYVVDDCGTLDDSVHNPSRTAGITYGRDVCYALRLVRSQRVGSGKMNLG